MKTVNLIVMLVVFLTVALVSTMVVAGSDTKADFKSLDKNGDGYISVVEASGKLDLLRKWVDTDKNADGQIEITEFSAFEVPAAATFEPVHPEDPEPGAGPTN